MIVSLDPKQVVSFEEFLMAQVTKLLTKGDF
jgi:hypothetical protein